ncbi:uncharacterized protein PODANS_7_805 [Podospora anserina S mat+]|uniref:Podospora anserina S mat+ genomic DNA chromosome 7, supercontig 3 n=1 Tax=Podospora anserina (strain S / ATCC MYA-4624 / DSM 980 / FGSC 10383) TaxID=515849 RepID=B2AP10_PODAN|nr:uncharacterized protein PODANS_7_805 [Podospora anserina S mat+]CAP65715.1 unnamed protein product [Podospora anserina S mat+]CDP32775.1 Putative protein of unknown function [Podospora anserina S mat+]
MQLVAVFGDCNIVFDPNTTTSSPAVFELGAVNKTHLLEADPDIAGTGTHRRPASNQLPVHSRRDTQAQHQAVPSASVNVASFIADQGHHDGSMTMKYSSVAPLPAFYSHPASPAQPNSFTPYTPTPTSQPARPSTPPSFTPYTPTATFEPSRSSTPPPPRTPSPQKQEPSPHTSEVNIPDTATTKTRASPRPRTKSEILYDLFEAALLSISDSQLLLSVAQMINFAISGLCTTSRYHVNIGLHLVLISCWSCLISCWSCLISISLLRNFWKNPATAFFRVAALAVLMGTSGTLILSDRYGVFADAEYTAEYRPPPVHERNSSLLFLPAACFIDKQLHTETFNYIKDQPTLLAAVGAADTKTMRSETVLWGLIIPVTIICVIVSYFQILSQPPTTDIPKAVQILQDYSILP